MLGCEARPLAVELANPFRIAGATLERVENAAVLLHAAGGASGYSGWGESPSLPPVTALSLAAGAASGALPATAVDWPS